MGNVIEFPNPMTPNRTRDMYPTCGALAIAPEEVEDALGEIPSEELKRHVEVIPFPGAWESTEENTTPQRTTPKPRIRGSPEIPEMFSGTYESIFFPLSADVYRLAAASPSKLSACDAENPYKFVSRQYDVQADLYYLRARYYSARSGRFISQDPFLGFPHNPLTLNRYTYSYQNPIRYFDPSGYFAVQAVGSIFDVTTDIVNAGFTIANQAINVAVGIKEIATSVPLAVVGALEAKVVTGASFTEGFTQRIENGFLALKTLTTYPGGNVPLTSGIGNLIQSIPLFGNFVPAYSQGTQLPSGVDAPDVKSAGIYTKAGTLDKLGYLPSTTNMGITDVVFSLLNLNKGWAASIAQDISNTAQKLGASTVDLGQFSGSVSMGPAVTQFLNQNYGIGVQDYFAGAGPGIGYVNASGIKTSYVAEYGPGSWFADFVTTTQYLTYPLYQPVNRMPFKHEPAKHTDKDFLRLMEQYLRPTR